MIALTLAEMAAAVGGTLADADPQASVSGPVVVDSRAVTPGALFVAIQGARVDGHEHAADAFAAGAVACLGSRPVGMPTVVVDDPVAALGRLAAAVIARLERCTVIAVTGSQGKTGTKDLLSHVLASAGATVATEANYNNEIGVPLTALRAGSDTEFLVVEMGARGRGHIRFLSELVRPDIGCVLNVGTAHIGEFGTREAIAEAKGELVEALPATGTAVLNADDSVVLGMVTRTSARVLTFGQSETADLQVVDLRTEPDGCAAFRLAYRSAGAVEQVPVRLRLLGEHQALNAAAAAAVALAAGCRLDDVATALATAGPGSRWRMQPTERADGVLVVNDAYNANPDSMQAALKTLVALSRARGGRSFAVLGEMAELGEQTTQAHDAVGRLAVRLDVDQLVVVGEAARTLHLGACLEGSWNSESLLVPDADAAVATLRELLRPGDTVLVKASRAAALEQVAEALIADVPASGEPR
jgi:UDP-N-acetylmuramoyl-tripeptide--D-alanyl-D-alanine ligase